MIIKLPYGKTHIEWHAEPRRIKAMLHTEFSALKTNDSETEVVKRALAEPYGSAPLTELAKNKKKWDLFSFLLQISKI